MISSKVLRLCRANPDELGTRIDVQVRPRGTNRIRDQIASAGGPGTRNLSCV